MDFIWESITDWLKEILISGIVNNLSGLFDSTNEQVATSSVRWARRPKAGTAAFLP